MSFDNEQTEAYARLGECLDQDPGDSLRRAAFRVIRGRSKEHRQRMAAHAVLDIGNRVGSEAWAGIRRAIRIYDNCHDGSKGRYR